MFDFLPTVGNCCFCFSLKVGSILIALCGLVALGTLGGIVVFPICGSETGLMADIITYFGYVTIGVSVLLMIFSLLFLIAACMEKFSIFATLFLIAIVLFLIMNLASLIVAIVGIIIESSCRENLYYHASVLLIPIWFYFLIVVRSYKDEMV